MKRIILALTWLFSLVPTVGATDFDQEVDSLPSADSTIVEEAPRKLSLIRRIIRGFDKMDERYIEPQHYLFTVMLQTTYTYDYFTLRGRGNYTQSVSFAPDGTFKVGPYFGWKWVFLGYTFALNHSNFSKNKTEIDFSLYSNQVGLDLFYRRTGSDYKVRDLSLGRGIDTSPLEDVHFDGIKAGITGLNVYYIFNHGHFSYPAAFAQSTCQKISCGSWMAGIGYTKNTLDIDFDKLQDLAASRLGSNNVKLDSTMRFLSLSYHDITFSLGYGYNWVFAPKWLFASSLMMGIGNQKSVGNSTIDDEDFSIENLSPHAVGRFGLVYNNTRWYAGFSAIIHSNWYRKSRLSTNNTFGSMNAYVGYNFGLKKKYRKNK